MREFMAIARALSDENRVRILMFLNGRELCVCRIIAVLRLAPSTVSKHLFILKAAYLIESRKQGKWIHYRLAGKTAPKTALDALDWARTSLRDDNQTAEDLKRLKTILKISPEKLCQGEAEC